MTTENKNMAEPGDKDKSSLSTRRRLALKKFALLAAAGTLLAGGTSQAPASAASVDSRKPQEGDPGDEIKDLYEKVKPDLPKEIAEMIDYAEAPVPGDDQKGVWDDSLQGLRITDVDHGSEFSPSHIAESKVDPKSGLVFTNVCGSTTDSMGCYVIYVSEKPLDLPLGGQGQ